MAPIADSTSADGWIKDGGPFAVRHVCLIAPSPPPYGGMALQAKQLEQRLVQDGNSVTFFPSNFLFPKWMAALERIPVIRTLMRAAMIWILLWRRIRNVEVVHVLASSWLYFFVVVCPAVIVGRLRGKRIVLNYRGGEAQAFLRSYKWAAKPVFRWAHVVTTPSEFLAGVIRSSLGIPVSIVPNILDTKRFQYRERKVLQPRMIVTRHLEEIYDVESVLRAFRILQQRHSDAVLWIAGTGSQAPRLRQLVEELELKNVSFLGHVPHEQLPALYDQCDILVNASRVDNFPGSLVEASAAGLVVVSTWAGGIPFLYQDGASAMLVAPGDWRGLAGAVERVLDDPQLAASLTARAKAVAEGCDWRHVRKSLYAAYDGAEKGPR